MWYLMQVLPFSVRDLVNERGQYWHLFILLREICSIVFGPVGTYGLAVFLKQRVIEHHTLLRRFYDINLIPKHHFMIHYSQMMVMSGPVSQMWCMRFESKHNQFKKHSDVVGNLKNISKTLRYKHQIQKMQIFKLGGPFSKEMNAANAHLVFIGSFKESKCCTWESEINQWHADFELYYLCHPRCSCAWLNLQNWQGGCGVMWWLREEHQILILMFILPELQTWVDGDCWLVNLTSEQWIMS